MTVLAGGLDEELARDLAFQKRVDAAFNEMRIELVALREGRQIPQGELA